MRGGRRLSRGGRQSGAGSLDDRGVPLPPRARAGRGLLRRARAVRAGGVGVGRGGVDRRDEDVGERVDERQPRLRADRARDPARGGGDRSSRGRALRRRGAATSCPSTCAPARAAARRCARRRSAWSANATRPTEPVDDEDAGEVAVELDPRAVRDASAGPAGVVARGPPRRWRRSASARRARSRSDRTDRLFEACRRLEEELDVEQAVQRRL